MNNAEMIQNIILEFLCRNALILIIVSLVGTAATYYLTKRYYLDKMSKLQEAFQRFEAKKTANLCKYYSEIQKSTLLDKKIKEQTLMLIKKNDAKKIS